MKITIDLEDLYPELEEGNLNEQIKEHISGHLLHEIWKKTEVIIKDYCDTEIKKQINDLLYKKVSAKITDVLLNEKLKKWGNDTITINEWIPKELERLTLDRNYLGDAVTKLAKETSDSIKKRYDLLFATQIVSKIAEQGLLKDDVAKLLLDSGK